jgi:hypothetical protein
LDTALVRVRAPSGPQTNKLRINSKWQAKADSRQLELPCNDLPLFEEPSKTRSPP